VKDAFAKKNFGARAKTVGTNGSPPKISHATGIEGLASW